MLKKFKFIVVMLFLVLFLTCHSEITSPDTTNPDTTNPDTTNPVVDKYPCAKIKIPVLEPERSRLALDFDSVVSGVISLAYIKSLSINFHGRAVEKFGVKDIASVQNMTLENLREIYENQWLNFTLFLENNTTKENLSLTIDPSNVKNFVYLLNQSRFDSREEYNRFLQFTLDKGERANKKGKYNAKIKNATGSTLKLLICKLDLGSDVLRVSDYNTNGGIQIEAMNLYPFFVTFDTVDKLYNVIRTGEINRDMLTSNSLYPL